MLLINNKPILRISLFRGSMIWAAALSVKTALAFALLGASLPCVEAFAIFLLALRLFTVACLLCGCIFRPVFPHGANIFYLLAISGNVNTLAAGAFLSACFSIFEALTVKFDASCFFTHTSCFPLLLWCSKIFGGFDGHILSHLGLFWVVDMFNRSRVVDIRLVVVQVDIFDGLDGRDMRLGYNEPHFIGENIFILHDGMDIIKGWKTIHGKLPYILLPS